jgi:four helix bundle protein
MKNDNLVQKKSFEFAISIVNEYKKLVESKREFVLSKQLVRSGTSIGANVEEAIGAQSKPDFISKMSIAYKEAREITYWIKLLTATGYLTEIDTVFILEEAESLCRIIGKILITSKEKMEGNFDSPKHP